MNVARVPLTSACEFPSRFRILSALVLRLGGVKGFVLGASPGGDHTRTPAWRKWPDTTRSSFHLGRGRGLEVWAVKAFAFSSTSPPAPNKWTLRVHQEMTAPDLTLGREREGPRQCQAAGGPTLPPPERQCSFSPSLPPPRIKTEGKCQGRGVPGRSRGGDRFHPPPSLLAGAAAA